MREIAVVCGVLLTLAFAAGCGSTVHTGSTRVRFADGVFHIGSGVDSDSLTKSVLGLGPGVRESTVRRRLGAPSGYAAAGRESCWAYHAVEGPPFGPTSMTGSSNLDAIVFCMSRNHRVARIALGMHG